MRGEAQQGAGTGHAPRVDRRKIVLADMNTGVQKRGVVGPIVDDEGGLSVLTEQGNLPGLQPGLPGPEGLMAKLQDSSAGLQKSLGGRDRVDGAPLQQSRIDNRIDPGNSHVCLKYIVSAAAAGAAVLLYLESIMKRLSFLATALLATLPLSAQMKFDFGSAKPKAGFTKVAPGAAYSDEAGYGFEPSKGEGPVYFTVKVPEEGNYRVTVTLGDEKTETMTTIKAEIRRLMLVRVHTDPGKFVTRSFLVNIRTSKFPGGEVRLKDREKGNEAIAWDNKMQLEFTDTHPGVRTLAIEKDDKVPTIFIAGDSTSTDQPREPFSSWGQSLPMFFKPEIAVANHGESGESLRGFFGEKRVDKLMSVVRPGDWLFIQMGHNDQKEKGEGVGALTTYKADLKRLAAMAKEKGVTVVLVSPMNRLTFAEDGKTITNSLGDYPEAVREAGKEDGIAVIDLNAMSKPFYESMGPVEAHKAFAGKDTTHHSDYGSYELARCIVQGIKDDKLPLVKYLNPIPAFDPAHPDPIDKFDIPAEPMPAAIQRPLGN